MKKIGILLLTFTVGLISVLAIKSNFKIELNKLSFNNSEKKNNVLNDFEQLYELNYSIKEDTALEDTITKLSKKTTKLLLGDFNNTNESSEEYYKRRQEYMALRYNPEIPKDENSFTGLDEDSEEYLDDIVSGMSVPGIFNMLSELGVIYNSFGSIRISNANGIVISTVVLPNVGIKEESKDNPMEYKMVETNLIMYYYFKSLNGEYKLYYLYGETTDELEDYMIETEENENVMGLNVATTYDSNLREIYDFSKLDSLTETEINNVYEKNKDNIVYLNSYYNSYVQNVANGFFIKDNLIVTTWNFIEKSLIDSQQIIIKDVNGIVYEFEGIVTLNPNSDIAVLKVKAENKGIDIGNIVPEIEDVAILLGSKMGIGTTLQKGIIIANDGYLKTSIPLSESNQGSPIFDRSGNMIGMNTSKLLGAGTSIAVNNEALKEVYNKFDNVNTENIKVVTFDELKSKYYYQTSSKEEILNNIPKSKWNEYAKIGNIEESLNLELVKANYKKGIVSLRYKNSVANLIDSMMLISSFKDNLVNDGYKLILNESKKLVYENSKYQIVIMEEFDYVIIVMVKL
ncbi:MAG: trypsin-like peptidase domain-containing protein [Bacilli bacterium]|nr:trypsin-like peptidase domain-containing protein [Bacilli bacterium]